MLTRKFVVVIAGYFTYGLLKVFKINFLDIVADYFLIVNKPSMHVFECLIDLVYIKKTFVKNNFCNAIVENIYFSDHDAKIIVIEKMLSMFILFHKIH